MAPIKQATAQLPMDDPDLNNEQALFAQARATHDDLQLIKARLDGLTEALSSIANDVKAIAAKPVAAATSAPAVRPFGGGGGQAAPTGGTRQTLGLVDMVERQIPKRSGGTFTVISANFSNGWQRDVPKQFINYFSERIGQEVTFTQQKNSKGYQEITSVG